MECTDLLAQIEKEWEDLKRDYGSNYEKRHDGGYYKGGVRDKYHLWVFDRM